MECQMDALKARIKKEKALAEARENAGGGTAQTGTTGRVQDKAPPPMGRDLSLDDYYPMTKLEHKPAATQRANLKLHLSQGMRGIL